MSRLSVFLAASFSLLLCSFAFAQNSAEGTATRPGSATRTAAPGMPTPATGAPQTGTARIRGRVVVAQTGAPLRRAQVSLNSSTPQAPMARAVMTDAEGRFEFAQLPAGRYSVAVSKTGYVGLRYGQRRPTDSATTLTLADGERLDSVDFALPRGGVIVARITDEGGEPLPGAQVQVQRYQYGPDGQRRLNNVFVGNIGQMNATDDRGEVRLYGLAPGEYVVSASYRNLTIDNNPNLASVDGFAPTFHPGTTNPADAQLVTITLGEEVQVDFPLSSARLSRVSGSVVNSQGRPAAGSFVQVVTYQGSGMFSSGGGQVTPDGTFTINGVAPGEYSLEVRPNFRPGASEVAEFGSASIVVAGADITGVRIVTGGGATISGRVVFEGFTPTRNPQSQWRVIASATDPSRPYQGGIGVDPRTNGTIDAAGNFQLSGVSGRVLFTVIGPVGIVTKSVVVDGQDVTDDPIEFTGKQSIGGVVIRVTDKLTQISGRVSDDRGVRPRECTVVFQSAEEREPIIAARWLRTVRCDSSGAFQTRGMRPGRYVVTAVGSLEPSRQFEPDIQRELRRAGQSFVVREGETMSLDLKLTP
jgi:hypothetical protein